MANKRGRPRLYTRQLAEKILDKLSEGVSLRRICEENDDIPPASTVRQWVYDDVDGFAVRYARARDIALDNMADETLDIADSAENDYVERERKDGSTFIALDKEAVMRSSLRVDARKWYLSKLAPKRYDKTPDDPPAAVKIEAEYKLELRPDESRPEKPIL